MIVAGAGSGKTRVLTRRIAYLVENLGISPWSILAVTFTTKAAQEMKERTLQLLSREAQGLWIQTFHSLCVRVLRTHSEALGYPSTFTIYDSSDQQKVARAILKALNIDKAKVTPKAFLSLIEKHKRRDLNQDELEPFIKRWIFDGIAKYEASLKEANAMDFNDLLLNTVKLFEENPEIRGHYQEKFQYILIDEFQDTNLIQYQLIKLLVGKDNNILAVGDDDQSIYGFRGATPRNLLHFEQHFRNTKVIALEQNYRSSGNILAASNAVVSLAMDRKEKKLWTSEPKGEPIRLLSCEDEYDEASRIGLEVKKLLSENKSSEIAIFYRANAQSRALEESLTRYAIPYRIIGTLRFYERKEIKDILSYLRFALNPCDIEAMMRASGSPSRGIGEKTLENIVDHFHYLRQENPNADLIDALSDIAKTKKPVARFFELIEMLFGKIPFMSPSEVLELIIRESGYLDSVDKAELEDVKNNFDEIISLARNIEQDKSEEGELQQSTVAVLSDFLDRASLTGNYNEPDNGAKVSLLTMHLAKGLEFETVFLTGLEEGTLPHYRCFNSLKELSEERRLCYVGITRAKKLLYISSASYRQGQYRNKSRFISDIPLECLGIQEKNYAQANRLRSSSAQARDVTKTSVNRYPSKAAPISHPNKQQINKRILAMPKAPPSIALEDLTSGTRVSHPIFGSGTVMMVERGERPKVSVSFDDSQFGDKTLAYAYCRLDAEK